MRLLSKLERMLGPYSVRNLTLGLIICQVVMYLIAQAQLQAQPQALGGQPEILEKAELVPRLVLQGEVWRVITFLAVPPMTNPVFAFFGWYLFYLMGTALELYWGIFRYNVFLLIGYLATVAVSFLVPDSPSSNGFLYGSVFLAFAYLNPDFVLSIFFILPVKIRWLALLTWIGYFVTLITGPWILRLLVMASVSNFLLFFNQDIIQRIKIGRRRMVFQTKTFAARSKDEPFHRCVVCGITDKTHPMMDFRYCPQCKGTCGYCTEHIRQHDHITVAGETVGR